MKKVSLWATALLVIPLLAGCASSQGRRVQSLKANLNAYIQRGHNFMRQGNPNGAYRHYTQLIRNYSRYYPHTRTETAKLYIERGKVTLTMNYPKKAQIDFNEAKRLCPGIQINVTGATADVYLPPKRGGAPPPSSNPGPAPPTAPPPAPEPAPEPPPRRPVVKVKIAILDFKEPPVTQGKGYGSSFSNMLTNEIAKGSVFSVVERSILDKIIQERNLSQTDLLSKTSGSEDAQKLLAVKYLLYGNITVEGNAVTVTARLIDWGTGLSVCSDMSKRIFKDNASPSFYFDEIARDLGRKLENGFLRIKQK